MATKVALELIAAGTSVPAATPKANAVIGTPRGVTTGYGGMLDWRITNVGALGAPCVIMFQTSPDGLNWFDLEAAYSADLLANTVTQGPSIPLRMAAMNVRAIAYGNTNSQCLVEAWLEHVTGL